MMNTCGYEFSVYPWYHGDLKRTEAFKAVEEFRQVRSHHNLRQSSETELPIWHNSFGFEFRQG